MAAPGLAVDGKHMYERLPNQVDSSQSGDEGCMWMLVLSY